MEILDKEKKELLKEALKNSLLTTEIDEAINNALNQVEEERGDEQLGLFCRWSEINAAMLKYWRFNQVTMIAGGSGSGKSFFLNMLEDDFTNTELNKNFPYEILILSFKYEMDASDELLRTAATRLGKSYAYLLSAEWKGNEKKYNKVDNTEFIQIKDTLNKLKSRPIKYFETAGSLKQFFYTVYSFHLKYPDKKLIVTLDHTLLSKRDGDSSDLDLMSQTALILITLRKLTKGMFIILNQLNGEIEKPLRRENASLHYPVKTDIHCGNQVFWACDNVIINNRPELLGIEKYGKLKYATKNLLHAAVIKSRKGVIGDIWLKENLKQSQILSLSKIKENNEYNL